MKNWLAEAFMPIVSLTDWQMVWAYLAWSYAHDLLLRPLLARIFSKPAGDLKQAPAS